MKSFEILNCRNQLILWVCGLWFLAVHAASAQTNYSIYSDQVDNGFQNWSWGTNNNFSNPSPVYSGADSIAFASEPWTAISFWHSDFNPGVYSNLNFWANGGATGGQIVQIYVQYNNLASSTTPFQLPAFPTNSWRQFSIPLSALGVAGVTNMSRLTFQMTANGSSAPFFLDDVSLATVRPSLVHLQVNATNTLRTADARWFGLNTAIWDNNFDTSTTSNALTELGTQILRFPGGSASDEYHWGSNKSLSNTWTWATSFANFIHVATNIGAQAVITVNYGTGTPAEAAAWVRSANLTNHCNFKYWEVGNENYGTWETDSNTSPHDPYTYATRAVQYITQMKAADPTIKIGIPAVTGEDSSDNGYNSHPAHNPRTGANHNGWTPVVLATMKSLGTLPDYLVYHVYPEYQNDSDQALLQDSGNWSGDAANLRQQLTDYVGSSGTNIELLCTENNADAGAQGRQSTSLVNGLYLADSLAHLMKTEFNSFVWWDLRNGTDTTGDFNSGLYGWRTNGDLGIIGNLNTRYPAFYAFKLMCYFARAGDTVLNPSSDYFLLSTYAARHTNGALTLLVINKDRQANFNAEISVTNFQPNANALIQAYGIPQDEAARTNGAASLQDISLTNFSTANATFTYSFPPYSLTLFTFAPAAPQLVRLAAPPGQIAWQLQGQPGTPYVIQASSNLVNWTTLSTNLLVGNLLNITNDISADTQQQFLRAVWRP